MKLGFLKLHRDTVAPSYATPGDAGLDLHSTQTFVVKPGKRVAVPTGLSLEIPEGYVGLVWDKSGRALHEGLTTIGGVIDSTYRGEILVLILNTSEKEIVIDRKSKVAQLLIQPVQTVELKEIDRIHQTVRGEKGFGSTGLQ